MGGGSHGWGHGVMWGEIRHGWSRWGCALPPAVGERARAGSASRGSRSRLCADARARRAAAYVYASHEKLWSLRWPPRRDGRKGLRCAVMERVASIENNRRDPFDRGCDCVEHANRHCIARTSHGHTPRPLARRLGVRTARTTTGLGARPARMIGNPRRRRTVPPRPRPPGNPRAQRSPPAHGIPRISAPAHSARHLGSPPRPAAEMPCAERYNPWENCASLVTWLGGYISGKSGCHDLCRLSAGAPA